MLANAYETEVKLVPHITVDFYLKDREVISIQFNSLQNYEGNFYSSMSYIKFDNAGISNNFDKVKTAFLNKEIKKCILSAKGIRKNCLTQEEEFYPELEEWKCRLCSFKYRMNSELEPVIYSFCFDDNFDGEGDEWIHDLN